MNMKNLKHCLSVFTALFVLLVFANSAVVGQIKIPKIFKPKINSPIQTPPNQTPPPSNDDRQLSEQPV